MDASPFPLPNNGRLPFSAPPFPLGARSANPADEGDTFFVERQKPTPPPSFDGVIPPE